MHIPQAKHPKVRGARAAEAFDCLNHTGIAGRADQSVAAALTLCGWNKSDALDFAIEWELTSANDILPTDQLSLAWSFPDPTYEHFGTDDHFVYDQRPRVRSFLKV